MYTSYIGKKFLKLYNERENKKLSARDFFDDLFFDLFFQENSHLMYVGNSPFFQKPKDEDTKKYGSKSLAQLNNMRKKIDTKILSGSILVGFAAEEIQATTSGQLTSINFQIDEEEIYASWIGEALAMRVSGPFIMLIDKPDILWALFNGWQFYRKYIKQTPNLKDKQIETWNGHWLCHSFSRNYNPENVWEGFEVEVSNVQGIAIPTQDWSKIIFALAKKYPNETITAYCYNLSQTNTTLGFINLYLPEVRRLYELKDKIFVNEDNSILTNEEVEKLKTSYSFKDACKLGTIGLKALEPDKLRTYMPKGSVLDAQGKDFKFTDEKSYFDYQLYKLWITAMLNKTELLNLAADVAKALLVLETASDNRGKKDLVNLSESVRTASNIKTFIDKLTEVLEKLSANADTFKNVVEQVLKMPSDNFPLFATLIRFEYQYQKSKS